MDLQIDCVKECEYDYWKVKSFVKNLGILPERLQSHVKSGTESESLGDKQKPIRHNMRVSERGDESLEGGDRLFISKIKRLPSQETEVE